MAFTANDLETYMMNDSQAYKRADFAVKCLRQAVDRAAEDLARHNRAWHDDPEAEDHAAYHAPTEVQFPRAVRDRVMMELTKQFLRIENEKEKRTAS